MPKNSRSKYLLVNVGENDLEDGKNITVVGSKFPELTFLNMSNNIIKCSFLKKLGKAKFANLSHLLLKANPLFEGFIDHDLS